MAAWWSSLGDLVVEVRRPADRVVGLVDANPRVGSSESPAVGPAAAEKEGPSCLPSHE